MSKVFARAIQELDRELDAIDQRRGEIEKAIQILRPLAGDTVLDDDEEVPHAPASRRTVVRRTGAPRSNTRPAARKTDGPSKGEAKGTRPRRSRPDGAESMSARIVDALRVAGGTMKPAALAAAVGLTVTTLRYHVNQLIAAGQVEATGATMNPTRRVPPARPPWSSMPPTMALSRA